MPKIRGIKPETWTDDKFVSLEDPFARLLFLGMWNFACDNGHLDDNPRQIKLRVLPADDVDAFALIDALVAESLIERHDGYLKITNLTRHQSPDLRFLIFCDHCDRDEHATFARSDKRGRTKGARSAPQERTTGAPRNGDVDGDGDGEGEKRAPRPRRSPETPIPEDWRPTKAHEEYATNNGIDLSTEAFKFRNHAVANDRRQRQWNASFSTWLAKAKDYAPPRATQDRSHLAEKWR